MRIFYILFFFLLTSSLSYSQSRLALASSPGEEIKVRIYPNPAVSKITFNFERGYDKNFSFQIFNFIGKKVYETQSVLPVTNVDLTEFFRGVYIFQLRDRNGKIIDSGKFQVSN
jgi:hypothetical protein